MPLSLVIPFAQQRFPVQRRRLKYKIICYESFSSIWICWAFLKGCISARLAVKQISKADPVLSLAPLILAMESVYGNGPDCWQRMITPGYDRKSYIGFSRFWNPLSSLLPHLHTLLLIDSYLRFPILRYHRYLSIDFLYSDAILYLIECWGVGWQEWYTQCLRVRKYTLN